MSKAVEHRRGKERALPLPSLFFSVIFRYCSGISAYTSERETLKIQAVMVLAAPSVDIIMMEIQYVDIFKNSEILKKVEEGTCQLKWM